MEKSYLEETVVNVKKRILYMSNACGQRTHLGGSLSMAELLTVLYKEVMHYDPKNPSWEGRDRFILSKGHCVLAYYAVLAECGFIGEKDLATFQQDGTLLGAHPIMNMEFGIESSNGSLGQGISMAVGLAKAAKIKRESHRIYVLIGNGESNEGAVWEAAMLAAQWKLDNLTVIMDNNHMQSDGDSQNIISSNEMQEKWKSFGFQTVEVDGHNVGAICDAFRIDPQEKPKIIIGNTVKGHGISFMENNNEWHHNRMTDKLYAEALKELGGEL